MGEGKVRGEGEGENRILNKIFGFCHTKKVASTHNTRIMQRITRGKLGKQRKNKEKQGKTKKTREKTKGKQEKQEKTRERKN